jgi:RNA polymerase sigma-70 factor, ECF subfamily
MSLACETAGVLEGGATAILNPPSETPSPEQELIRQLQAGNGGAYSGFVERYAAAIFRVAHGILGNRGEAEEITQQVFVKIFLSIAGFGGRSSLYSWIYRITVNECYSTLRKRRFTISLDAENDDGSAPTQMRMRADPGPRWDTVMAQRNYLNRLLATVPSKDRHLLLLREVEGLSMAELAEATGLNENVVKLRLFRTRRRLASAAARLQGRGEARPRCGERERA